jgi:hypothetical protein
MPDLNKVILRFMPAGGLKSWEEVGVVGSRRVLLRNRSRKTSVLPRELTHDFADRKQTLRVSISNIEKCALIPPSLPPFLNTGFRQLFLVISTRNGALLRVSLCRLRLEGSSLAVLSALLQTLQAVHDILSHLLELENHQRRFYMEYTEDLLQVVSLNHWLFSVSSEWNEIAELKSLTTTLKIVGTSE